jgi:hypothetical protein
MARLFVEGWSPDFGAPFEADDAMTPAEGSVDTEAEMKDWAPVDGVDDGASPIAFVDGVRRVDARLSVDAADAGPTPGICGTLAVGATVWNRSVPASEVSDVRVERVAVIGAGRPEVVPNVTGLEPSYTTEAIADPDPYGLVRHLHTRMRRAEGETASALAGRGWFVVADGPLNDLAPLPVVGHVKSHRVTYLKRPEHNAVVRGLGPGQRTPVFTIAEFQRYSWYLRLAHIEGGHPWSGVVRCEASGSHPLETVRRMADRTAAVLPNVASEPHTDPRAPQNLVPVAALEGTLKHLMGDRAFVYRAIRDAIMRRGAS